MAKGTEESCSGEYMPDWLKKVFGMQTRLQDKR